MRGSTHFKVSGGGVDADYQAVLNFASNNAIPLPTTAQQEIDNQLLIDYKASGAWDKHDVFFKFKGTASADFKLICWKRLVKATAVGNLIWSDSGVEGAGGYINSLFVPSTNAVNFTSLIGSVYMYLNKAVVESKAITGVYTGSTSNGYTLVLQTQSNQGIFAYGGAATVGYNGFGVGLLMMNRGTESKIFTPTVTTQTSIPTGNLSTSPLYILARNNQGTADILSTESLAYYGIAGNLENDYPSMKTILV